MAIAKAICKCGTCGKEFVVSVYRNNSRDARSFEEWAVENITECKDCENARIQKMYDEENAKASCAAKEMGYPDLLGTEKQIAWATTIREKTLTALREKLCDPDMPEKRQYVKLAYKPIKSILLQMRQAGWWIEHQHMADEIFSINKTVAEINRPLCEAVATIQKAVKAGEMVMAEGEAKVEELLANPAEVKSEQSEQTEQRPVQDKPVAPKRPEAKPEKQKHEGSADIRIVENTVCADYDKNNDFMEVVKAMGFRWINRAWQIESSERNGTVENIAAELGSRLLNAGFSVRFDNQEIMNAAVNCDYSPMCKRWISSCKGGFYIVWSREDNLYYEAKSIPGAKYDSPGVVVPDRSWDCVLDFAEKHGYRITAMAQEKIDALSGASNCVSPAPVNKPDYKEKNVLDTSRDVIEDLKD